jgi:parallel beta-helix repeat protein
MNGFKVTQGGAVINGFSIQKNGIDFEGAGSNNTIRNNYFYNCGVDIIGLTCSENTIMNNQITNGTVTLCETWDNVVKGNKITKARIGLYMYEGATCTSITGNTFSYCDIGVQLPAVPPGMIGNTYLGNKINIKIADY